MIEPEQRLWIAVLVQLIKDAGHKGHRDEVIEYLEQDGKEFTEICILAEIQPETVKARILKAAQGDTTPWIK